MIGIPIIARARILPGRHWLFQFDSLNSL